ncbi:hypothetical protein VXM67_22565 [Pseudomonas sp. Rh2]|uniref:hypothetical protein n=1 Tax=Pseudomonas sp. Rh2 TaxID=3112956 RepID=UPI00345DE23F
MSFAYGEIVWPNDGREANIVLRKFMLIALAAINYTFPEDLPSPINFVEKYISREIDQLECRKLAAQWRIQIPGLEGVRDFHSRDALSTRLAMLLLSDSVARERIVVLQNRNRKMLQAPGTLDLKPKRLD